MANLANFRSWLPFLTMSKLPSETRPFAQATDRAKVTLEFLARRIRSLRQRQGMTQEEFASRCGISVSFASLLERGERSPSYETMVQISEALELPLAELFRNAGGPIYDDPYYSKLVEFARRRKLSRAQVDRLIAVGHAVFDGRLDEPARPPVERSPKSSECSVAACGRPVLAKGLCSSHYHRARRASQ
jgi:transcriptional regulator with XRE-family HTH domain